MSISQELLSIPANVGRSIVETGATIACPLLGTDQFIKYCRKRGVSINRERLIRLERLRLFAPVFRVKTPNVTTRPFSVPLRNELNWFEKGYAWDTTDIRAGYVVPSDQDRTQEGYYSVFQIDHLHMVSQSLTATVHLDAYLDRKEGQVIDWEKKGQVWTDYGRKVQEELCPHEYRPSVALLCQYISNRYYPQTQTDQRTIQVGAPSYSDKWVEIAGHKWEWSEEVRKWKPQQVADLFKLTPENLRQVFEGLAVEQEHCDPLQHWYPLMQFVSVDERVRLKGAALRAETLRSAAYMVRLLYKDLFGVELPHPNEVTGTIITHVPELAVRADVRRYLEFVVNRFGLNPQPRLVLFVEGQSEGVIVPKIFERCFGVSPGVLGIEIIVLGSVDTATGSKREDRFRAIFRLLDYLHHHQTMTFIVLDNENSASRLKQEASKARSVHNVQRYTTPPDHIHLWKCCFEFDNFSCTEIATAMTDLAQGRASFTLAEVATCAKSHAPGSKLQALYKRKANYGLQKIKLNERLFDLMISQDARRQLNNRPIVKVLKRVQYLAGLNRLPTMHDVWEKNQTSNYLGKKIQMADESIT